MYLDHLSEGPEGEKERYEKKGLVFSLVKKKTFLTFLVFSITVSKKEIFFLLKIGSLFFLT